MSSSKSDFVVAVFDFFSSRGINFADFDFMEMPKERERYDLSRVRGNVNLLGRRFEIKSEFDKSLEKSLHLSFP